MISDLKDVRLIGEIYFPRIHHSPAPTFMTTLVTQDCRLANSDEAIPANYRGYFQQRLFSRIHQLFLQLLRAAEDSDDNFSRRMLSRRIEKKPEQITRWLSYPGNLTLETISDLAIGMGCEIFVEARSINRRPVNSQSNTNVVIISIDIDFVKASQNEIQDTAVSFAAFSFNKTDLITKYEKLSQHEKLSHA